MLEPAVRPGGLGAPPGARRSAGPIETRDFDSLLNEARAMGEVEAEAGTTDQIGTAADHAERSLLGQLAGVDRIANGSVIGMFEANRSTILDGAGPRAGGA